MPRVSIVIAAYNAETLLPETLRSVLQSSFGDFEVVVVNDGSRDQTASVAAGFGHHVRVIDQPNMGMSAARNNGINSGDSEFVALLDSDDLWHPDKLRLQVSALDEHRDHGLSFTNFSFWNGKDSSAFMAEQRTGVIDRDLSGWIYHRLVVNNWALPSSMLFSRRLWNDMGPFLCDDQQTDDWEWIVRCSQNVRFLRLAESMVLYRQHPESLSRKLPLENNGELMRESLIARHGMCSIDGTPIDPAELEERRYVGWRNFAVSHCSRGNLALGLNTFGQLLLQGPRRAESLSRLIKSVGRRIVPANPKPSR